MTVIVGSMVRTSMGCGVVAEMRHDGIICVNLRASNTNGVYQGYFTLDSVAPMGRTTAETVRLGYEKDIAVDIGKFTTSHHQRQPSSFMYAPTHTMPMQLLDTAVREKIGYEVHEGKKNTFSPQAKKIRLS